MRICEIEGCERKHCARGMCSKHYQRWLYAQKPDVMRAYQAAYRKRNPGKVSDYSKKYYAENADMLRERARRYRQDHPDRVKASLDKYRENNRDELRRKDRERRASDPEYRERRNKQLRDRRKMLGGTSYRRNLSSLMEDYAGMCGICGEDMFGEERPIHVDHIIPVSKGGTDDYENLQPAHAACNIGKGNRIDAN